MGHKLHGDMLNFRQGAILSLFECINDFNEYLISGDYMSHFNNFKILYHLLHIFLGDFGKVYMIRIIFIRFQWDFMRLQSFFVKIQNRRLKSRLIRFYVISYDFL